ncbi:MAG: hypothetical protein ACRD96_24445, partial [Bryobacteraceae bacterium]
MLETGTAEIGRYVSSTEFNRWPVVVGDGRRQIQGFIFASLPGTTGSTFQGSINGGQYYSHEILIEGIPLGRFDLQGGSNNEFSPSPEVISEFKVQTGTVGAQYGGAQTAVANFGIKSGTNEIHGTGYLFMQNDALRANTFTNNSLGRVRPPFKQANYGYAVGGPIYLPKVYDGRNKTFFFNSTEILRERVFNFANLIRLPSTRFKQGDFSQLFSPEFTARAQSGTNAGNDAEGRAVRYGAIYDPATTRRVGNAVVRDIFPGNIVPRNRWSPVSAKILEVAPIPDPLFDRMLNNTPALSGNIPVLDERNYGIKVDHHFSSRHRMSGYYNHQYRLRNNGCANNALVPPGSPSGTCQNQYTPGRLVRIAEDWTITPSILNHFAIGFNRFRNRNVSVFLDQDWPSKIGLQNVPQTTFPDLRFDGQAHLGGGIGNGGRLGSALRGDSANGSWITQDDVTIIRGRHNYKAGFELRKYYYNTRNRHDTGIYRFDARQTRLPGFADQTGHAFASFLLGALASTQRSVSPSNFGHRVTQPGFYFMDDWKATRKLTLNIGMRWEIIGGLYEVAGRMSGVDLGLPNPAAGNRPGALVFVDDLG